MRVTLLALFLFTCSLAASSQITVSVSPSACNGNSNLYNLSGKITGTLPTVGQIIVSVENEGIRIYELPFTVPFNFTITGLNSDGAAKIVTATFTNGIGGTASIYNANYNAPSACITNSCVANTPGQETYTFTVPLQTTDLVDLPLTLPKFDDNSGTRTLQKVLLSAKTTMLANAIAENQSATAVTLTSFSAINSSQINQAGNSVFVLPDLKFTYKNIPFGAAVVIPGMKGTYPGDISSSTLNGMAALTPVPSPIQDVVDFNNPYLNANWVTKLTGDANDANDIVYFRPAFAYSTNNEIYETDLTGFIGTGSLGYTYSTLGGYSFSGGGGNFQSTIATRAAATISITYYYCGPEVLPVTLLSFNADNAGNNTVKLTWTVGEQINVKRYEIEHSLNGSSFSYVGKIIAGNNLSYSFNYPDAKQGLNYFRLKTIDNNGKISYSKIVKEDVIGLNSKVLVYPNPAKSYVNISLGNIANIKPVTIKIVALDGRILSEQKVNALSSSATINTNNLAAGKYFIKIATDSKVVTRALEILR